MKQNRNGTMKITWHGGGRFDVQIRRHTIRVDQPTDFGGGDTGPVPVELFVGSLAACVAHRAERYLHRCELPAGVTVTARYDLGLRPARVGRIDLVVDAPGLPEGLRESFTTVIEHSAVHNSLRLPPEITLQVRTEEGAVMEAIETT
ncbi:OsmC family protein [Streptosporangium sp. NPDC002544]|uniref:OsmC family protein n=1 Tax=Streptosporangium sp. NPDC002544 TaxID=3154538 RepID=UPI003323691D